MRSISQLQSKPAQYFESPEWGATSVPWTTLRRHDDVQIKYSLAHKHENSPAVFTVDESNAPETSTPNKEN